MKMSSIVKLAFFGLMLGSLNLSAATPKQTDDERGLLDFLTGATSQVQKADVATLRADDSLIIEDLDTKCGDWDDWGCCPKRRIKAHEICAQHLKTSNLRAHHAKIKELCSQKAKIEKLWTKMLATDLLFAEKAKIDKLWAGQACAYMLCAHKGNIKELLSDLMYTDSLKAEWAHFDHAHAETFCTPHICAYEGNIQKFCATEGIIEDLKAIGNVELQTQYRAFVFDAVDQPYTLGSDLLFDTVADDPNGNITQGASTTYTAPVSGYYMLSYGISAHDLQGPFPIAGQPINHPSVLVNGIHKLQTHLAFLSFSDIQNNILSSIVHLNAGDVCTFKYELKYIDPVTGEQPYPGTMTLIGVLPNYTQDTFMAIHYLSSDKIAFEPCEMGSPFEIGKPCIPPCCPCPMQKPPCEVNCHGGHCGDHHGHGECGDHDGGPCGDHDDHGHHDGPCGDHDEDHGGDHDGGHCENHDGPHGGDWDGDDH